MVNGFAAPTVYTTCVVTHTPGSGASVVLGCALTPVWRYVEPVALRHGAHDQDRLHIAKLLPMHICCPSPNG
ncbi:MAG: hypothetical protein M3248_07060 [Actinomycetota bacterium]|nr:hypothetical protein [Actinomycetota bacterium]